MAKRNTKVTDYKLQSVWFNDREKQEYGDWADARKDLPVDAFFQITDLNCKLSMVQDQSNGVYIISLTPKEAKLPVHGTVFIFRHNDLYKGVLMALYYYVEVLDEGRSYDGIKDDLDW